MAHVPMTRARALIICHRPQAYAPTRVREAAAYLLQSPASTEDDQRLASEAFEWLLGKREQASPKQAEVKQTRKEKDTTS